MYKTDFLFLSIIKAKEGIKKRFSLVELLVAIAIAAILVSMLQPALKKAMGSANALVCKKNLKKIYTGALMYVDDNGGWLPTYRHSINGGDYYWPFLLKNYTGVEGNYGASTEIDLARGTVYACPSDEELGVPSQVSQWAPSSYGTNRVNFQDTDPDRPKFKIADLSYPSESSYFMDNNGSGYQGATSLTGFWGLKYNLCHSFGMNVLYVDGHVDYKHWVEFPLTTNDVFWEWENP